MKIALILLQLTLIILLHSSFQNQKEETHNLTIEVKDLHNSSGTVLFALYNREDAFPYEHYKKYLKKSYRENSERGFICNLRRSTGWKICCQYPSCENNDGKIKKGMILPKEGIGFSNYQSIGLSNKPSFSKASFDLQSDKAIKIKIIYL